MRVLVFVILVGSAVCSEPRSGAELRTRETEDDGASLAIVFDTTRSMYPELDHVKRRAAGILQAALTRPGWPVKDFVLAPFNDPRVPKATVTEDPKHFQELLERIVVDDGGDCAEKALTGLLNALKVIRPRNDDEEVGGATQAAAAGITARTRSTVFVFTDASAKDYHLLPQVLQIVQRKQPVVVFVTSGGCKEGDEPSRAAFAEIASISSGHIFQLNETDVDMVMDFLDRSLKEHKVNLLSVDKMRGSTDQHTVLVDPTIHEILVAVSGSNPEIIVTDPSGQVVDQPPYVVPVVDLENVKVIALREPDPGSWKINTSSSSPHSVRFTGVSTIDFIYGFSAQQTDFINETYHRPLKDADNYILVASSGMGNVWNLTNIELTALNGSSTQKMPLDLVSNSNGFYRAGPFIPPDAAFYLTSYGYGNDKFPLKRITPTAILPELPEAPQIHLQEHQTAPVGRQISLFCQIESLIPLSAWWTKENRPFSKVEKYKQTATVVLMLDVKSEEDAGQYKCVATNARGNTWKTVNVTVTGPPPEVLCPAELKATPYGRLILECTIVSVLRRNVSWSTPDGRSLDNNTRYTILANGTLIIDPFWPDDSQQYYLTVTNAEGESTASIQLALSEPISVQIEPISLTFQKGHTFSLNCVFSGGAEIRVRWERKGAILDEDKTGKFHVSSSNASSILQVNKATSEEEGIYKCVAYHSTQSNSLAESSAECRYVEHPQVVLSETNPLVKLGDDLTVTCAATGIPVPEVTWLRLEEGQRLSLLNYIKYDVRESSVVIHGIGWEDNGTEFVCEAQNEAGKDEALVRLKVGIPPHVVGGSSTKKEVLAISESGALSCSVNAIPKPSVVWRRNGEILSDMSRFRVDFDRGDLFISDIQVEDGGIYECIAENIFGRTTQFTDLTISGLKPPVIAEEENLNTARKAVVGADISMNCIISGLPKPQVAWYHNDELLTDFGGHYKMGLNESLLIERVESQDAGLYKCEASNPAGTTSTLFVLQVITPPKIAGETNLTVTTKEGQTVFLPCDINTESPADISWSYDGQLLLSLTDRGLTISDVRRDQGGVYVCTVSNEAGTVNRSITLNVLTPPEIEEKDDLLNVVAEVNVFLPCMVSGNPPPNVSWTKDDLPFNVTDERYATDSGLVLLGVTVADSGVYTCLAENAGGSAQTTTRLEISVPAWIRRSQMSELSVLEGENAFLPCEPNGTPFPDVGWTFRGLPLNFSNNERLKFTAKGMEISAAKELDSGAYTCSVANSAGSDSQTISLIVNVPAKITSWDSNPAAVIGQDVELNCTSYGFPEPEVTWYREDEILAVNSTLRFVAQPENAGNYLCVASNLAGKDSKKINVTVFVPPQVETPAEATIVVSLGLDVDLDCLHEGVPANPQPSLSWYFNETRLTNKEDPLVLGNVNRSNEGVYICKASNTVANVTRTILVKVHERPRILEKLPSNVTLLEGEDFSMKCSATGNPAPLLAWYRDYQLIPPGSDTGELLLMTDNTLVIIAASNLTGGNYTCIAINEEGHDSRSIQVNVDSPLLPAEVNVTTMEVIEADDAVLNCPGTGPSSWYKDGEPVNFGANNRADAVHLSPLVNGSLKVFDLSLSDSGNYSCVNTDGQQAHFELNVLSPPYFDDFKFSEEKTVVEGQTVSLDCRSSGNPTPKVIWKKNDSVPVTQHTTPGVIIVQSSRHQLRIPSVRLHHAGTYKCTAVNKAGQSHRNFLIHVIVAPDVVGPTVDEHEVMLGANVSLECPISGQPKPTIAWERIHNQSRTEKLETSSESQHSYVIYNANLGDSGEYSCTGSNKAGSKTKLFKVFVLEPPVIAANSSQLLLTPKGSTAILSCASRGWPKPSIYWLRNGHVFDVHDPNENRTTSLDASSLTQEIILHNLSESDAGTYVCTATNLGGSAEKIFTLQTLVAPSLGSEEEKLEVHAVPMGRSVSLRCAASGQPPPKVSWYKDGKLMDTDALLRPDVLSIWRVNEEHAGNYTCVVSNIAGNVSKSFQLDIQVPPFIVGKPGLVEYEILRNESVTLFCNVSGHPTPQLVWLKGASTIGSQQESRGITLQSGNQSLVISNAELWHSGRYSCLASNDAGSEEVAFTIVVSDPPHRNEAVTKNFTLVVVSIHRRTALVCAIQGYPQPNITWYKDGELIVDGALGENAHISSDGRQLLVLQATQQLSGDYFCEAHNRAGSTKAFFTLQVEEPAEWSEWSDWGLCSATCDSGKQKRFRECVQNGKPGKECHGEKTEQQACFVGPCPVNGGWGQWSTWSACSQSCGRSNRIRNRKCDQPEPEAGGGSCQGLDQETDVCEGPPCPVDGEWSEWSSWSDCSASCGESVKSRSRQCSNPAPQYGGSECIGPSHQKADCDLPQCQVADVAGGWTEWTAWSGCSVSCGTGHQMRRRSCGTGRVRDCLGENWQIQACKKRPCRGDFPRVVSLRLRGKVNGRRVRDEQFSARVVRDGNIVAKVHNIQKRQAVWQNYLPFILSPVSWSVAKENGDATNGYTLTKGSFKQTSQLVFDSGEQLSIEHEVKGNDDKSLQVDVKVYGRVPRPKSDILLNPITEDLVQTGANSLQSITSSSVIIDGARVPYTWNKTIVYDPGRGTMPYRAERISTKDISSESDSNLQEMKYSEESIVTKFDEEDRCPEGFQLNQRNRHCIDLNECENPEENGCHESQHCENLIGSYRCYCSEGYRSLGFGTQCLDVNECMTRPSLCSHECRNIPGSYLCICPVGMALKEDRHTCEEIRPWSDPDYYDEDVQDYEHDQDDPEGELEFRGTPEEWSCPAGSERSTGELCVDRDECLTANACREHEACLNTRASFECIDVACPKGFRRYTDSDDCVMLCGERNATCASGALVAETTSYIVLTLEPSEAKPKMALVHLAISQEGEHTLPASSFKIIGKQQEYLFKVRGDNGHGVLYSTRQLEYNTKYRIMVEAQSFGLASSGEQPPVLYTTNFIVTLYVLKW